jgi:hypothetical protein
MPTGSGPKPMSPLRFRGEEGICPENECPESWMSARNWTAAGEGRRACSGRRSASRYPVSEHQFRLHPTKGSRLDGIIYPTRLNKNSYSNLESLWCHITGCRSLQ